MRALSRTRLLGLAALAIALGGCGRTYLDTFSDGAPPNVDASVRDVGPIDVGPIDGGGRCLADDECTNGIFCDGLEVCRGGVCFPGTPPTCDDGIDCTSDRCSEAARACESIPDSSRCPEGICDPAAGGCTVRPCMVAAECSDGVFCNGEEQCIANVCRAGTAPACSDGVDCTFDECDERSRTCTTTPLDSRCNDGRFCNGAEVCTPRGCASSMPVFCEDGMDCTTDACDDGSRMCVFSPRDADRDGVVAQPCGGGDCNDSNPSIRPGVPEICGDDADNDCNGQADCRDAACAMRPELSLIHI